LTGRFVLVDSDRSPVEFSLAHRLRDDLQVGVEYDPGEGALYPLLNWRFVDATDEHPAVALGVSSAWPSSEVDGSAVFVTAAQNLGPRLAASISLAYGLEDERLRVPASLSYTFGENLSGMLLHDGDQTHPILTYRRAPVSFSLIFLNAEDAALSISWGF
jgi:hypothetical protein